MFYTNKYKLSDPEPVFVLKKIEKLAILTLIFIIFSSYCSNFKWK